MELHFTMHNNWAWVLKEALEQLKSSSGNSFSKYVHHSTMKNLPSQIYPPQSGQTQVQGGNVTHTKRKPTYSLFRFESVCPSGPAGNDTETLCTVQYGDCKKCCWLSAQTFGFIDPKDVLYECFDRILREQTQTQAHPGGIIQHPMPLSYLLPWDTDSLDQIPEVLPSNPTCLLKAALGSGGHGIYFMHSRQQVLEIIRRDAIRARGEGARPPGGEADSTFIAGLKRDHGGAVPQWSLQQYINSVRVFNDAQRCQFRVYVVYCSGHMYVYDSVEVRVPRWEGDDLDNYVYSGSVSGNVNVDTTGNTADGSNVRVREYNDGRDKKRTYRYVLEELENDFVSTSAPVFGTDGEGVCVTTPTPTAPVTKDVLLEASRNALNLLRKDIESNIITTQSALSDYSCPYPGELTDGVTSVFSSANANSTTTTATTTSTACTPPPPTLMAIAGIDLLVDQSSGNAYVVEFNNNPAMPGPQKGMSSRYKDHLIHLAQDLITLGHVFDAKTINRTVDDFGKQRVSKLLQLW